MSAMTGINVHTVPMFEDNYSYIVLDAKRELAAVVDPADASKVAQELRRVAPHARLAYLLTTHAHSDHSMGNEEFVRLCGSEGTQVLCGEGDRVPAMTKAVGHDDVLPLGDLQIRVLYTPCHTPGHVCFFVTGEAGDPPCVFTGDTLFVAGCGNLNQGTPAQMHHALCEVLGGLPPETRVFCGHEYTVKNLQFARTVEPDSEDVGERLKWAMARRERGEPTVPSTIADELKTNPFMRVDSEAVQRFAGQSDPVEVLRVVRERKNHFGKGSL